MVVLKIILSAIFTLVGVVKLLAITPIRKQFKEFGLPKNLMYVIGILEIGGAFVLQYIEDLSFYAAIGLAVLMLGAIVNHIKVKHPFLKIAPSLLLLIGLILFLFLDLNK